MTSKETESGKLAIFPTSSFVGGLSKFEIEVKKGHFYVQTDQSRWIEGENFILLKKQNGTSFYDNHKYGVISFLTILKAPPKK